MKTIFDILKEALEGKLVIIHKKGDTKHKYVDTHIISVDSFSENILSCTVILHHNDGNHTQKLSAHYDINDFEYEVIS